MRITNLKDPKALTRLTGLVLSIAALAACSGKSDSSAGGGTSRGNYAVSGKLTNMTVQVLREDSVGPMVTTGNVSHVMAVGSGATPFRALSAVGTDGTFSLNIDAGRPYVIVFIDSSKVGKNMVLGMFKSSSLDTLAPLTAGGSTEMGDVTVANTGQATSSVPYADLIASLGLSSATAAALGAVDDICLRYTNPDMDGDGIIDMTQENHNFISDFHVQLPMRKSSNVNVKVNDMLNAFLVTDMKFDYQTTGIIAAFPAAFSTATSGTFSYDAGGAWPITVVDLVNSGPDVAMTSGGAATSYLGSSSFSDMNTLTVATKSTSELPKGELVYSFAGKTLTFTNVAVPSNAQLISGENRFAPFLKFNTTTPNCTSDCTMASIEFKWMKQSAGTWVAATQAELDTLVDSAGGFLSIRYRTMAETKNLGARLLPTATGGTIAWNAASLLLTGGLTEAELLAMTEKDFCNVGLSYDDKLGMRYFLSMEKATGNATCN